MRGPSWLSQHRLVSGFPFIFSKTSEAPHDPRSFGRLLAPVAASYRIVRIVLWVKYCLLPDRQGSVRLKPVTFLLLTCVIINGFPCVVCTVTGILGVNETLLPSPIHTALCSMSR